MSFISVCNLLHNCFVFNSNCKIFFESSLDKKKQLSRCNLVKLQIHKAVVCNKLHNNELPVVEKRTFLSPTFNSASNIVPPIERTTTAIHGNIRILITDNFYDYIMCVIRNIPQFHWYCDEVRLRLYSITLLKFETNLKIYAEDIKHSLQNTRSKRLL